MLWVSRRLRLPLCVEGDQLVVGAGRHAMRRGQHQIARDRDAGAGIAARADDHHRRLRTLHGRRAADQGGGGREACEQKREQRG